MDTEVDVALTPQECQRARLSRDPRFDGRFYVAVKTTGIFCRPICPANLPKEENVEYFLNQAQALQAGYRPCLRCRPDSAPSSWAWKGVETTFLRAMKLIDNGELQGQRLSELAERLGISDRYLRQLFQSHLGMSPKQYAQYHQLMFAKQLLHTSHMSITDIGFACGFNSTRRFNDAFQKVLKLTPSQVRRQSAPVTAQNRLSLAYRGPFDWAHMLAFYRLRAVDGIEQVEEDSYQRHVRINGCDGWFKATLASDSQLEIEFELAELTELRHLVSQLRRVFDLDADIVSIEAQLEQAVPELVTHSGIRIPGVWNAWEAGVRAILGQQVSIKAAIGQLNLLVATLNYNCAKPWYFPTPQQVADADLSFLRMPQSRKDTLHRFAVFMAEQPNAPLDDWLALKGVGPWTVNYARLRGVSDSNCFLHTDLVVKKALAIFPHLTPESVSPWGSYATFHCWDQ
ncbi:helix-turn-helix domain-containing protein [Vibrio fluvialis]|nr:helix-turn-helix domain-containing protein [Vibrio fluvialis]MBY7882692.1 helix-turn-helix domain-containing protein [Vibrio fluvialis]MBY7926151.1 helix-turn-helix domain-containing protein [Vibrio fluvialis]MBY8008520.1 helix-turn-helix domain-containing protein [Vibrio fluvialis]MBY8252015.1 helix-turn-helix domain-containing protein [Vibrio fluvialis]